MIPHLITYPRSGSHYFDRLIYEKVKFHIERSHTVHQLFGINNNKTRTLITIARDPKESIASWVALNKFLGSTYRGVNEMMGDYVLLYSFLYDNADYVIDYKDLIEFPDVVTTKILELLEIDESNSSQFVTDIDYDSKTYVQSSKTVPGYEDTNLDDLDFTSCYFYYKKLLERKVVI